MPVTEVGSNLHRSILNIDAFINLSDYLKLLMSLISSESIFPKGIVSTIKCSSSSNKVGIYYLFSSP